MIGQDFILRIPVEHRPLFYTAAAVTVLAAGSICTPWEITKIIGSTILTGIGYGIVNDMIASWDCAQHFEARHISDSFLRNHPPILTSRLNALISGMLDYWKLASIAGIVLATIARAPSSLRLKITATQITPYLVMSAALTTVIVQISSRILQKHFHAKKENVCNLQHAMSYGLWTTIHILAGVVLTARIGFTRL